MTGARWGAAALGAVALSACAAGIPVGDLTDRLPAPLSEIALDAPQVYALTAASDATVHSSGRWQREALGDEEWLMVGAAPSRGAYWFSAVTFDLSAVPQGAGASRAELVLARGAGGEAATVAVHVAASGFDERRVTWATQPRISAWPIAELLPDLTPRTYAPDGGDVADVSRAIHTALEAGETHITFVLVPRTPETASRHEWPSRESAVAPDVQPVAPTLAVFLGTPPPPPSAAERDLVRGGRRNIED